MVSKHPWITKGVSKKLLWEMASLWYKTIFWTHKQSFRCIVAINQAHHVVEHRRDIEKVSNIMDGSSKEPQICLNRSSKDFQKIFRMASKKHRRSIRKHHTCTTLRKLGWKQNYHQRSMSEQIRAQNLEWAMKGSEQ